MIYSGKALQVSLSDLGVAEICFDLQGESVNKINELTRNEFKEVIGLIKENEQVKGVLVSSAKPMFIVGADITEFTDNFSQSEEYLVADLQKVNRDIFNQFEDLPVPTVVCLNGMALGGGFELAMAADFRVMDSNCKVGLPETSLGIIPGYGGTVRLPRLIGFEAAIDWIVSAKHFNAAKASKAGAVDVVADPDKLLEEGLNIIKQCLGGSLDYRAKRQAKLLPLNLDVSKTGAMFDVARNKVAKQVGPHYPAPMMVVDLIEQTVTLGRDAALELEAASNGKLSKTVVAKNLIGLFIGDQAIGKSAKLRAKTAKRVAKSAVLGAGIMGGGIAYQTALKGTPIIMKDIAQEGIDLGLGEAAKLLSKRVSRGQMTPEKMADVQNRIEPSLNFDGFEAVDVVVEAVVENIKVKHAVLAEVETKLSEGAVLTSNTSTISINKLATVLTKPEQFCGMHFFNPVPIMPLVEVIRGQKTTDDTVARVCSYALAMGKKPVVVNDCPGFLINRILSPYLNAFVRLVKNGVDYTRIDRVMESFGWPMGPAYLVDVIGIDTLTHGQPVLAEGYPDRMDFDFATSHELLMETGRLGQKNGLGYYSYQTDETGRPTKTIDPAVAELLTKNALDPIDVTDEEIADLMMLAMCLEAVRCLEDGIVDSATEIDMALIYAIGFPRFHGGALRYLEAMGFDNAIKLAEKYQYLGGLFAVPDLLSQKAEQGSLFYSLAS